MKPRLLLWMGVLLLPTTIAAARTWTDAQGRQMDAKFVRIYGNDVVLLRGNKTIKVPLSRLSAEDRAYLRRQLEAKGQGEALPPALKAPTPPIAGLAATARTWTDNRGRQIQAEYVKMLGNQVTLRVEGKEVSVPLEQLSLGDQQYVKQQEARSLPATVAAGSAVPQAALPVPTRPGFQGARANEPGRTPSSRMPPSLGTRLSDPTNQMASRFSVNPPPSRPEPRPPMQSSPPPAPVQRFSPSNGPSRRPQPKPQVVLECSNCRKIVPDTMKAGDNCPHCGTFFSYEKDAYGHVTSSAPWWKSIIFGGGAVPVVCAVIWLIVRLSRNS